MPTPRDAADPRMRYARRNAVLRGIAVGLAIALSAVGVWLIVTSSSQKRIELGVLAGLWGGLFGAFAAFGVRRLPRPGERDAAGRELAVREHSALERADESAARLRFEARLEQMLRQEIQTTFGREIAALREEVASLRNDLLEKVGGQLRLERIETTRVIGSDIEALYREIDQLKHGGARALVGVPTPPASVPVAAFPVPHPAPAPIASAHRVSSAPPKTVPPLKAAPPKAAPEPVRAAAQDAAPPGVADALPPEPVSRSLVLPPPGADGDPFAELPRLQPFTDDGLLPVGSAPPRPAAPHPGEPHPEAHGPVPGRHGVSEPDEPPGGGRRRRAPDAEDNVLARILAREASQR